MSRPFGVAMLLAGVDPTRPGAAPQLFHLDPSGTYLEYDAKAIGSGAEWAQQHLQTYYKKDMSLPDAIRSATVFQLPLLYYTVLELAMHLLENTYINDLRSEAYILIQTRSRYAETGDGGEDELDERGDVNAHERSTLPPAR